LRSGAPPKRSDGQTGTDGIGYPDRQGCAKENEPADSTGGSGRLTCVT
jgi:hypothetical protein